MQLAIPLIISLFCQVSTTSSTLPGRKFQYWFSEYEAHFEESSTIVCNYTLQQYLHPDLHTPQSTNLLIAHHADCILANTTETIQFNMASAAVMLGLMPSLMASFGPTLAESSVLLLERPFLGFVLAIGSPAMYPSRPLESYNPLDTLTQPPMRLPIASHGRKMSVIISLIQLLVAVVAAGNVIATSLELGAKTVVTWKKANSYLPLTWVVLAQFIYMLAVIRLRLLVVRVHKPQCYSQLVDNSCRGQKEICYQFPHPVHLILSGSRILPIPILYIAIIQAIQKSLELKGTFVDPSSNFSSLKQKYVRLR